MRKYAGRRIVAVFSMAMLLFPAGVSAGPLLASALRAASQVAPEGVSQGPPGAAMCQQFVQRGEEDGLERQGRGGWLAGGLALNVFFVPVMPIIAYSTDPAPPVDVLAELEPDDMRCYATGYVRAAKGKRVRAAWVGYGLSYVLAAALVGIVYADE